LIKELHKKNSPPPFAIEEGVCDRLLFFMEREKRVRREKRESLEREILEREGEFGERGRVWRERLKRDLRERERERET
jgi:hypothetical protein